MGNWNAFMSKRRKQIANVCFMELVNYFEKR